jgi:hypothetical protein
VVRRSKTHSVIIKRYLKRQKSGGWPREEDYMEPRKGGHDSSQVSHDFEEFAFFYAHTVQFVPGLISLSH